MSHALLLVSHRSSHWLEQKKNLFGLSTLSAVIVVRIPTMADLAIRRLNFDRQLQPLRNQQRGHRPRNPNVFNRRLDPLQALSDVEFKSHFKLVLYYHIKTRSAFDW